MENGMTHTFHEVERMLYKVCNAFRGRLKWDELVSAAHVGYVKAFWTHTPEKGDFTTWCWFNARKEILDEYRKLKRVPELFDPVEQEFPDFDAEIEFIEWRESLPDDAKRAVEILLGPHPKAMKKYIKFYGGETPDNLRNALREYLTVDLKWGEKRTADCFRSIRKHLKEK